jgi:hypothetical protein
MISVHESDFKNLSQQSNTLALDAFQGTTERESTRLFVKLSNEDQHGDKPAHPPTEDKTCLRLGILRKLLRGPEVRETTLRPLPAQPYRNKAAQKKAAEIEMRNSRTLVKQA